MKRDFTYVDDIVERIVRSRDHIPGPDPNWSSERALTPARAPAPYRIYNIGNNQPVELLDLVSILESKLGRKAGKQLAPMQPRDVPSTYADVDDLIRDVGFQPATPLLKSVSSGSSPGTESIMGFDARSDGPTLRFGRAIPHSIRPEPAQGLHQPLPSQGRGRFPLLSP